MSVFRISEMVSLAIHSMVLLALHPKERLSARQIAETTGGSETHLAKVLRQLSKAGLVDSVRGPKGGFTLAHAPSQVALMDIYQVFEGNPTTDRCPMRHNHCPFSTCVFGDIPQRASSEFGRYLQSKMLSDFVPVKPE